MQTNPNCPDCGARMLRWAWFESEDEPYRWWYCLECEWYWWYCLECDLMGKGTEDITEAIHVCQ